MQQGRIKIKDKVLFEENELFSNMILSFAVV